MELDLNAPRVVVDSPNSGSSGSDAFKAPKSADSADSDERFHELPKGQYKTFERIGKGTFSIVYRAEELTGRRRMVALKRISAGSLPQRAANEMRFLDKLKGQQHVVELFAAHQKGDQTTIVLPYFEHQHFKDYYFRMSLAQVRRYMRALFESLKHLHVNRVIHRDIKPSNFLHDFEKQGPYCLVDFGLAHEEIAADSTSHSHEPDRKHAPRANRADSEAVLAEIQSAPAAEPVLLAPRPRKRRKTGGSVNTAPALAVVSPTAPTGLASNSTPRARAPTPASGFSMLSTEPSPMASFTAHNSLASQPGPQTLPWPPDGRPESAQDVRMSLAPSGDVAQSAADAWQRRAHSPLLNDDKHAPLSAVDAVTEAVKNTPRRGKRKAAGGHSDLNGAQQLGDGKTDGATDGAVSPPPIRTPSRQRRSALSLTPVLSSPRRLRSQGQAKDEFDSSWTAAAQARKAERQARELAKLSEQKAEMPKPSARPPALDLSNPPTTAAFVTGSKVSESLLLDADAPRSPAVSHLAATARLPSIRPSSAKPKARRKSDADEDVEIAEGRGSHKRASQPRSRQESAVDAQTAVPRTRASSGRRHSGHEPVPPAARTAVSRSDARSAPRTRSQSGAIRQKTDYKTVHSGVAATRFHRGMPTAVPPIIANPSRKQLTRKPDFPHAPRSGTRGFRAPEVVMRVQQQTVAIDIWSAGVIFLCILTRRYPFFAATDDMNALFEIVCLFGRPRDGSIPFREAVLQNYVDETNDVTSSRPWTDKITCFTSDCMEQWPQDVREQAFDLLRRCLEFNPSRRISAAQALEHAFLASLP